MHKKKPKNQTKSLKLEQYARMYGQSARIASKQANIEAKTAENGNIWNKWAKSEIKGEKKPQLDDNPVEIRPGKPERSTMYTWGYGSVIKTPPEEKPDPNQAFRAKKREANIEELIRASGEPMSSGTTINGEDIVIYNDFDHLVDDVDEWDYLDDLEDDLDNQV